MAPLDFTLKDGKLWELECLRGAAAFYVVLHHTAKEGLGTLHPILEEAFSFGQEAVIVFFLLSGFVVHYATQNSGRSWTEYAIARVRRIYPIFLAALAISALAFFLKNRELPGFSAELAGNLVMLQDRPRPGTIVVPFLGNSPLWSLSYEAVFYALYPITVVWTGVSSRAAIAAVVVSLIGILSVLVLPNQIGRWLGYYIVWWAGVELCKIYLEGTVSKTCWITLGGLLASTAVWIGTTALYDGDKEFGSYPILELRHFVAAVVFFVVLPLWSKMHWRGFNFIFGVFAIFAPISYALYVVHYPIMLGWAKPEGATAIVVQWIVLFLLSVVVAGLLEGPYQRGAKNLFAKVGALIGGRI